MSSIGVIGLGHVAMYVEDMERSKKFYQEILEFKILTECIHENSGTHLCFLGNHGVTVELVQLREGRKRRDGVDGTVNHLCIKVADIEAAKKEMETRGIQFETEILFDPQLYDNGEKNVMFRGPDGEHLQIEQIL